MTVRKVHTNIHGFIRELLGPRSLCRVTNVSELDIWNCITRVVMIVRKSADELQPRLLQVHQLLVSPLCLEPILTDSHSGTFYSPIKLFLTCPHGCYVVIVRTLLLNVDEMEIFGIWGNVECCHC